MALFVKATIMDAENGDQLCQQTLAEWDEMNQEEGLPPMREQLAEWERMHQPKEQPKKPKTFKEETEERCAIWEKENGRSLKSLSREEWIDAMMWILCAPRFEVEEMLNNIIASRY